MTSSTFLGVISTAIQSAVFPRFCVRCEDEGDVLCTRCFADWEAVDVTFEANAASFLPYADPITRDLLRTWKYHFDLRARDVLFNKLRPNLHVLSSMARDRGVQAIVPVPLFLDRLSERGFDQAVEIAKFISSELGIPVYQCLARIRETGKQSERSDEERAHVMEESPFVATSSVPESVLLVDDVYTTGATAGAAERALRNAGAKQVWIVTIAKGSDRTGGV